MSEAESNAAEILGRYGNFAVVRMPGRKFPGVWFAADTLHSFLSRLESLNDDPEHIEYVTEYLRDALDTYVRLMQTSGEQIPFPWQESPQ